VLDGPPGSSGTVALPLLNPAATPGTGSVVAGSGSQQVNVGAFLSSSSATADAPDVFNIPLALKVHLTDTASGKSADLSFTGNISGKLTATTSTVTASFDKPASQTTSTPLGNFDYTVRIDPFLIAVPAPGSTVSGMVTAFISASLGHNATTPPGPGPKPVQTPEPSSLVLGATALSLLGLVRRCRPA
jgi:hypothetical protein